MSTKNYFSPLGNVVAGFQVNPSFCFLICSLIVYLCKIKVSDNGMYEEGNSNEGKYFYNTCLITGT